MLRFMNNHPAVVEFSLLLAFVCLMASVWVGVLAPRG